MLLGELEKAADETVSLLALTPRSWDKRALIKDSDPNRSILENKNHSR